MLRMGMTEMHILRSLIYGFGIVLAMHTLYRLQFTKKSLLDFVIGFIVYFLLNNFGNYFLGEQELVLLITILLLLILNHHIKFYQAIMFAYVTFSMLTYTTPIDMIVLTINKNLLHSIINQNVSIYGYLTVIIPGIILIIIYTSIAYLMRISIDIYRERLKNTYIIFGIINTVFIFVVSLFLFYIINTFSPILELKDLFNVIAYSYIGFLVNPIFALVLIKKIYDFDLIIEKEEIELEILNDSRVQAYRYSHNLNNIMLTLNQLAKQNQPAEIKQYLEKIK